MKKPLKKKTKCDKINLGRRGDLMNQIKIYDIAGSAGVSLATVSRVLNHPEKVKKVTREKVLRIIKEKGYYLLPQGSFGLLLGERAYTLFYL